MNGFHSITVNFLRVGNVQKMLWERVFWKEYI
jgi:hypothetical protein